MVDPVGDLDLFGDDSRQRAERARALEEQRILLTSLQGDVSAALQRLASGAPGHWHSESARRYAADRDDLRDEVRQVLSALGDAASALATALSAPGGDG